MNIETKLCTRCKVIKPLTMFGTRKSLGYAPNSHCKSCHVSQCLKYNKSPKGIIGKIYSTQTRHSNERGHVPPNYTRKEFREWMNSQPNFMLLMEAWITSGYNRDLAPSCDRLNDSKPYSFSNIRLVTWRVNREKGHADRRSGKNTKILVPVSQYYPDGTFIKSYISLAEASRATGLYVSNLSKCKRGILSSCGGYKWK